MAKRKSHSVADQFSDEENGTIKRYGQALGGFQSAFDEEVERCSMNDCVRRVKLVDEEEP